MNKIFKLFCIIILSYNISANILSISIPKCGTFLLSKCIELITSKQKMWLDDINDFNKHDSKTLFFWSHIKYSYKSNVDFNNTIKFLMIRDPRDQIISMIFWAIKNYNNPKVKNIHKHKKKGADYLAYKYQNFDQKIFELIYNGHLIYKGFDKIANIHSHGINQFYKSYLGWLTTKNICLIKFENLIGEKGGGSNSKQSLEIQKIAQHLGIQLTNSQIQKIKNKLFGDSYTFRKGEIGSWKKYFKPAHKQAFKKVAGQLLIELGYEKDLNW